MGWLLLKGVAVTPTDRHGNTPRYDARRYHFGDITEMLQEAENVQRAARRGGQGTKNEKRKQKKTKKEKEKEKEPDDM